MNVVLEIGTGSGYLTAILAELCQKIYSIERHPALAKAAEAKLRAWLPEHRFGDWRRE